MVSQSLSLMLGIQGLKQISVKYRKRGTGFVFVYLLQFYSAGF
jgi:hypothetical protein